MTTEVAVAVHVPHDVVIVAGRETVAVPVAAQTLSQLLVIVAKISSAMTMPVAWAFQVPHDVTMVDGCSSIAPPVAFHVPQFVVMVALRSMNGIEPVAVQVPQFVVIVAARPTAAVAVAAQVPQFVIMVAGTLAKPG